MQKPKLTQKLHNLFCYCGVSREEYNSIEQDACRSNFVIWKYLHVMIAIAFAALLITSLSRTDMLYSPIYAAMALYAAAVAALFRFVLKEDSRLAQYLIYAMRILLLAFGMYQSLRQPDSMAVSFIVLLVVQSMFMIDRPYIMILVIAAASGVYIALARALKPDVIFHRDMSNTLIFGTVAIVINVFYNALRVREFLMKKELERQRDTDDLTGLFNRSAMTRGIEESLAKREPSAMMTIDIDCFKEINDRYGHDAGDRVLRGLADCMRASFGRDDIRGRFGGDEFVVFLRGRESVSRAAEQAQALIDRVNREVHTPGKGMKVGLCIGIAVSAPFENNFDTLFKKTDLALYRAKAGGRNCYRIYTKDEAD